MPRRLLEVAVGVDEVDLVSDLLWSVGVEAIEERDRPGGVLLVTEATDALIAAVDGRWPHEVVDVDLAEALDAWRDGATATVLETTVPDSTVPEGAVVVLRAPWVPAPELAYARDPIEVVIDPGHAWGHGGHATTRGAAELLARLAARAGVDGLAPASVLDVGCGSGVLSVLACRLGASRVIATDIDPIALEITAANAARNESVIEVAATLPADRFDVVVANIDASVLVGIAGALAERLAPGGTMVLSGMLVGAVERVVAGCPGVTEVDRWTDGEWVAIALV